MMPQNIARTLTRTAVATRSALRRSTFSRESSASQRRGSCSVLLRSSLAVIFSAGLLLTAGVAGAVAHHVDDRPSALTPLQDDSGCGAHNDQGGENHDTKCDDPAPGGSGAT